MPLPPGVLAVQADCGGTHTVVIGDDSQLFGCGGNDQGQLGVGLPKDRLFLGPVLRRAGGVVCRVQRVSCGFSTTLLLSESGAVWVLGGTKGGEAPGPHRILGALERLTVQAIAA